ncbi:MAG: hypothetical protein H0U86_13305 [Chloroflexi bacterium]|nr:hypothetical protein [Chloroflexota bacterium]
MKRDRLHRPYRPYIKAFGAPQDRNDAQIYVMHTDPNAAEDAQRVQLETEWAFDYLGVQSYSLLTAYAWFALPQRLQSLLELGRQADRVAARGDPPAPAAAEQLQMIHWLAASQACMMIEEMAALVSAVASWRANGADIADSYLGWRGNITETINSEDWDKPEYWAGLVAYPGHESLQDLGMSAHEASALTPLVDQTLDSAIRGVRWARAFFTDEMRRVYTRFKHGFSLLSALSTPIAMDTELAPAAGRVTLRGSLLVLDREGRGPRRLLAMRCTGYDLGGMLQAATEIAGTAKFLAASLVVEARSPKHRGIMLATREPMPLSDVAQRALLVYFSGKDGEGLYRMNMHDDVVRLQRDLTDYADMHADYPFPLPPR